MMLRKRGLRCNAIYLGIMFLCLVFRPIAVVDIASGGEVVSRRSCATATCHGGISNRGPHWKYASSTFYRSDPHASAGKILLASAPSLSRQIVTRLEPSSADNPDLYDRVLIDRCISCHTSVTDTSPLDDGTVDLKAVLHRGIDCSSCHGNAGSWLTAHTQDDFVGDQRFDAPFHLLDTESVVGRANTCVKCHIGSRRIDQTVRDVNHDLIAAGHPAMRFDLVVFNENLPSHWNPTKNPEFAQWQTTSQVRSRATKVNMIAAATLSAERAEDYLQSVEHTVWPELADYDCFACHQSLSPSRYSVALANQPQFSVALSAATSEGIPLWNALSTLSLVERAKLPGIKRLFRPTKTSATLAAKNGRLIASRVQKQLDQQRSIEPKISSLRLLDELLRTLQKNPPRDWHSAAVLYLKIDSHHRDSVAAIDDDRGNATPAMVRRVDGLRRLLDEVELQLRFPDAGSKRDAFDGLSIASGLIAPLLSPPTP